MSFDAARLAAVISPLRRALLAAAREQEGLPDIPDAQIEIIRALPRGTVAAPGELAETLGLGRSTIWPTFHLFAPGHRIGVQVSSGAHPRYARNPGTGEPAADAASVIVADQEISHDGTSASRVTLPVWTS